jgi:hypothetical protein
MGIINDNPNITKTYAVSLAQMKTLIAKDLGVDESEITVDYLIGDTSDDRFGGPPSYSVYNVKITHKPKKI